MQWIGFTSDRWADKPEDSEATQSLATTGSYYHPWVEGQKKEVVTLEPGM